MINTSSYHPDKESQKKTVDELNHYLNQLYSITYSSIIQSVTGPVSLTPDMSESNIQFMAYEKLVSDGFAHKIPDSKSNSYIITYDGIQFLAEGGYQTIDSPQQILLKEQITSTREQRKHNSITIIISIVALLVATYSIINS